MIFNENKKVVKQNSLQFLKGRSRLTDYIYHITIHGLWTQAGITDDV
jgi:hypothetical protein